MAYVITAPCEMEKDSRCVSICPENAIQTRKGEIQYYINPNKCTDCGYCDLACPVSAIYPESLVPVQWKDYILKNKVFFLEEYNKNKK